LLWEEMIEKADSTRDPFASFWEFDNAILRHTLDGELDDAIETARLLKQKSVDLGSPIRGNTSWFGSYSALRYRGRADELLELVTTPELGTDSPYFQSRKSACLLTLGRNREAQDTLSE